MKWFFPAFLVFLGSCQLSNPPVTDSIPAIADRPVPVYLSAAEIMALPEVPVLCYHQLRQLKPSDSKTARDYIVEPQAFRQQVKMLADSGYRSILPSELYDYLQGKKQLPEKVVMFSFDDTRLDQYTIAKPVLEEFGFRGAFFIMTVSLGRPGYMSGSQVKELVQAGHEIGSHTWNHGNVKTYEEGDWTIQIDKPSGQLEKITGKKIRFFAYPFGLWNPEAIARLKSKDIIMAFQLSARRDSLQPLHTVRRIIVPSHWTPGQLWKQMERSF